MKVYIKLLLIILAHVILFYGLLNSDDWFLIIVFGLILYQPLHQFGPSIGYHRLFSHNSFKPKKWYPYLATFLSSISLFGDPLTYSLVHRMHHKYADDLGDPHSPKDGRLHAYIGWMLKFKPTNRDKLIIVDLIKKYPWAVKFSKYEIFVPIIFYIILFSINITIGYVVLMAGLIAFNSALCVNAFAHSKKDNPKEKHNATDNVFLAKWIMAIFMHKHHHNHGSLYDYSTEDFNDVWAKVIRKYLMVIEPK
jgi:stearoyl-CoA desaturase (delta-9 desaturase)